MALAVCAQHLSRASSLCLKSGMSRGPRLFYPQRSSSSTSSSTRQGHLFGPTAAAFQGGATRLQSSSRPVVDVTSPPRLLLPRRCGEKAPIRTVGAPMVAASDYAFRCLSRQYGADLVFTQMLHAKNLVHDKQFWKNHADWWETTRSSSDDDDDDNSRRQPPHVPMTTLSQESLLQGENPALCVLPENCKAFTRGPLVVQLAGHDPDTVVAAALAVVRDTERAAPRQQNCNNHLVGFDLNLGCPQGIARKGNYGAFFMEEDADRVCAVLVALRKALPADYTVSAKIRLAATEAATRERVHKLLDTGIDFLTIHGRTRQENKTKVRACHVDQIARAIQAVRAHSPSVPVIANGGVEHAEHVAQILGDTNASAVMSSEALLETPWVFQQLDNKNNVATPSRPREILERQFQLANDYLQWCRVYPPLPGVLGQAGGSCNIVRGHLFKILHRTLKYQPDLRERLASHGLQRLTQAQDLVHELQGRYAHLAEDDPALLLAASANASWYRRHREAIDRVHVHTSGLSTPMINSLEIVREPPSMEERKRLVKERIAKLKQDKKSASNRLPL